MIAKEAPAELGPLPPLLEKSRPKLQQLAQQRGPETWTKGTPLMKADAIAPLAGVLIRKLHPELDAERVAFLWKERISRAGRTLWGKAHKAGSRLRILAAVDFVIVINWSTWSELTPQQRLALLDHELEHCTVDEESGAPKIRHHDLEEFNSIVERWGCWADDIATFKVALEQLEMFEPAAAAEAG